MSTATQEFIRGDLTRLEQQKQRYELALRSATTPAARERHLRNVARLEDEIEGRREALQAVAAGPPRLEAPMVDVTGRYAALIDRDPAVQARRTMVIAIGIAFLLGFIAVALAS
jgi:hypothetical protein